ncbi:MAG: hypothetical protein RLZZ179_10 [Verrucomicrobiota bacterium]
MTSTTDHTFKEPTPAHIAFRPDIQGMRAVAVVAVILFHIHPNVLKGGFVGVDIFFVISGFVMGRLVYREVSEHRFSWRKFILRRIRRIMPALLAMIIAVTSLLPFIVGPERAVGQAKVALAAVFGVSNVPLWITMKYFGPSAETHTFLHTWSLAVEEQFYLILPLLLLWITRKQPARIIEILLAGTAISLAAAQLVLNTLYQTGAFYLIPFRAWELGLGLVAAISADHGAFQSLSRRTRESIAWLGTAAIAASLLLLSEASLFPGLSALPACLGTCLLLATGPSASVSRVLSARPLLWIGGISYSLYLWHVPCLAITRIITEKDLTPASACAAIAATLALSITSFYLIEQPFRAQQRQLTARHARALVTLFVTAVLLPLSIITSDGMAFRYSPEQRKKFNEISPRAHYHYVVDLFNSHNVRRRSYTENNGVKVLVAGDSFAQDFVNILHEAKYLEKNCVRTLYIPAICQPISSREELQRHLPHRDFPVCIQRDAIFKATDVFGETDVVFLAADWRTWSAQLVGETVAFIRAAGCANVVIVGTKRIPTPTDRMIMRSEFEGKYSDDVASAEKINRLIRETAHGTPFIDIMAQLSTVYGTITNKDSTDTLLSYDGKHLTESGAKFIAAGIRLELERAVVGLQL